MTYIKIILSTILLTCFASVSNADAIQKVLVINSYSQDYKWSNSVVDSMSMVLNTHYPGVELTVEYLSAERITDATVWVDRINLLFDSYANKKLSAIIIISDEAWMAYRASNRLIMLNNTPLFLCAVKPHSVSLNEYVEKNGVLSLSDFKSTQTLMREFSATGVIQDINVEGYFDLMSRTLPDLNNYTIITDNCFHGEYTKLLVQNYLLKQRSPLPIEYLSEQNLTADALLSALSKIDSNSGVLVTSWFLNDPSYIYSKIHFYEQMCSSIKSPIFATTDLGVTTNVLGGVYNEPGFWGKEVAQMVVETLSGSAQTIVEPKIVKDQTYNINWDVLMKYNIAEEKLPDDTLFNNRPESIFSKYRNQIIFGSIILLLLVLINIYVINNNLKLKKAQKITAQAIEQSNIVNANLINTQNKLKDALKTAEKADRLKSAFISSMEHEIRASLNLIVGFSDVIATMEDRNEIENAASMISENSEKLLKLIKDILELSQLESGTAEFNYESVDLNGMVGDLIPQFNKKFKNGITINYIKPKNNITLITEPNRVRQVLSSMIDNAVKFSNSGGVVEVGFFEVDKEQVEFYVKDNGVGIQKSELDRVFDHFYKYDSYQIGSGLGLSVAKIIIGTMGGEIGVNSEYGVGSRFWFRIRNN